MTWNFLDVALALVCVVYFGLWILVRMVQSAASSLARTLTLTQDTQRGLRLSLSEANCLLHYATSLENMKPISTIPPQDTADYNSGPMQAYYSGTHSPPVLSPNQEVITGTNGDTSPMKSSRHWTEKVALSLFFLAVLLVALVTTLDNPQQYLRAIPHLWELTKGSWDHGYLRELINYFVK